MPCVRDDDRRFPGSAERIVCAHDMERLVIERHRFVRAKQPVVVCVGIRRAVGERRGRQLVRIMVGVCDRRRDRSGVGRAGKQILVVPDVLFPRSARPRGADAAAIVGVVVGNARAVGVGLVGAETARGVEIPTRFVPVLAAVPRGGGTVFPAGSIVAVAERIGVAICRNRTVKRIVSGGCCVVERVGARRFAVQCVEERGPFTGASVAQIDEVPHDVAGNVVVEGFDAVGDAGCGHGEMRAVASERIVCESSRSVLSRFGNAKSEF